ncbi:uncharacterized protein LOC115629826 isoform X2 [Scaptodrosophila lebanonensis]|uniref:Uncharacterized protein LOC115629826 isoform X2 n=1 Tax=Drosophila lebanonensis TaxID=7225 RepID=A0A6J2U541_DROLE|nr:uncharacterized protein LOC115629826 isoform X2 [Scaptodrosophila lebanonensis]
METQLDKVLTECLVQQDTVGALVANPQGLCLGEILFVCFYRLLSKRHHQPQCIRNRHGNI